MKPGLVHRHSVAAVVGRVSVGAAGGYLLAVFVPGVYPFSLAAGKGVASGCEYLAHAGNREGVQTFAFGSAGVVPTAVLDDEEGFAIGHHLSLAGAECVHFLAFLVIDVMP